MTRMAVLRNRKAAFLRKVQTGKGLHKKVQKRTVLVLTWGLSGDILILFKNEQLEAMSMHFGASFNYFDIMAAAKKNYTRLLEPVCQEMGLTRNELDVMLFLENNPDFDRAVDIVTNRGLAKSHVSMSVASLEERGLLERIPDPDDRRTIHLKLTEKSREITKVACRRQKQFLDYLHQGVTEEQLEMMRLFAERVHENIKNIEEVI